MLHSVVVGGEAEFVVACLLSDQYGLTRTEYKRIYKRLARAAKHMGLTATIQ